MNPQLIAAVLGDALFAAVAATGFALVSNPPRRALPCIALLAAVGHSLRFFLMEHSPLGICTASLAASLSIGLGSVLFTRRMHMPAEFFSFPALLPMIPGMFAYKTILALMQFMDTEDPRRLAPLLVEIFRNGLTTFFVMCALVIGTLLPLFIFHKRSFVMTRLRRLAVRRGTAASLPAPDPEKSADK